MRYLEKYNNWILLLEKRDIKSREKLTVANRIVDFLKKYSFEHGGSGKDSEIFISFKTGDFETIIPPKSLGGKLYTSPQGFYCFDMNMFKQRLFGDEKISPENFNEDNLSRSNNIIRDLGLGYSNNNNKVDSENIWNTFSSIPRYLYFVKVKSGSLILSSNSNALKFYDPLGKLLRDYSHLFLKDNDTTKFDPKDRRDNGLGKMSFKELKGYFSENEEKYKKDFVTKLKKLFNDISKDEKLLHVKMYRFLMYCCKSISDENIYIRFNLLCRSIGIDGFTQRKGEDDFIHPSPEVQTLLLSEKCVEDLMKIDLKTELKVDRYVSGEKGKQNFESFLKSLKSGDVLYDKKRESFVRFEDIESFVRGYNIEGKKDLKMDPEKFTKVDLNINKIWQFIKTLKTGDWIKIQRISEESGRSKVLDCIIIQFKKIEVDGNKIELEVRSKRFSEKVINNNVIHYNIGEERFTNQKFDYNIDTKRSETPLFNPQRVNPPEYKYWIDNKSELEEKGASWDTFIDDKDKLVNNLEELFTNKYFTSEENRISIYDDMNFLTFLTNFSKEYVWRVYGRGRDFNKQPMTLLQYRGDLKKPIKVIDSSSGQDGF
jgi:hypothetical protein